jgi:transcriptional regulator with XRE-family HTH domain
LPKKWTGTLVGFMHEHGITQRQLAEELGVSEKYVSMVLNGHRDPAVAEQRFTDAAKRIAASRK